MALTQADGQEVRHVVPAEVPAVQGSRSAYCPRYGCPCGTFSSKSPITTPSGSWNIANVPTP